MSRPALLAAQLAQLSNPSPSLADPDARDAELLGANERSTRANRSGNGLGDAEVVDREHYLDVGPSRMRKGEVEQTLLSDKYGGAVRGRQMIFDDDEESSGEEEDGDEEEEEHEEDEDEEGDEDEDGDDDEADEDDVSDGEDEEDDGEDEDGQSDQGNGEDNTVSAGPSTSRTALDPLAALRDARSKDVLKGQAIKRQRSLFETLTSTRITFQKALSASTSAISPSVDDAEVADARSEAMSSLRALNEKLFTLREGLRLPGQEVVSGKRKRAEDDTSGDSQDYWLASARDSLTLTDASRTALVPVLTKWSTKIQAASLALGGKAAGSSKFLAGIKGQTGVFEAIEAGMASKRSAEHQPLISSIEPSYRLLLREIIAARTGSSMSSLPVSSYRLEKKKKRDAERGASKGRKIRYTVHEKAQNFAVAQPVRGQWGEDQTDELFASLLGGVGMAGGRTEGGSAGALGKMGAVSNGIGGVGAEEGLVGLGGLRVF